MKEKFFLILDYGKHRLYCDNNTLFYAEGADHRFVDFLLQYKQYDYVLKVDIDGDIDG